MGMGEDRHVRKIIVVVHYVLQVHTCLGASIKSKVMRLTRINLLIREDGEAELLLKGTVGEACRVPKSLGPTPSGRL